MCVMSALGAFKPLKLLGQIREMLGNEWRGPAVLLLRWSCFMLTAIKTVQIASPAGRRSVDEGHLGLGSMSHVLPSFVLFIFTLRS